MDLSSIRGEEEEEEEEEISETLNPSEITFSIFHHLLDHYQITAKRIYRQKAINKVVRQPTKSAKKRAQRLPKPAGSMLKPFPEDDLDDDQRRDVNTETEKLLGLDQWRYEEFPSIMRERYMAATAAEEGDGEWYMHKDEIVRLMEWKIKRGIFRPALIGMVKSNNEEGIRTATQSALKSLPTGDPLLDSGNAFPQASLDIVSKPIRGVGPATASLILSIATCAATPDREVPFYSDDMYLWLCLKAYPRAKHSQRRTQRPGRLTRLNDELKVKYNMHEYHDLWLTAWKLRERLNWEVKTKPAEPRLRPISFVDIEKVAFVIRHIRQLGPQLI